MSRTTNKSNKKILKKLSISRTHSSMYIEAATGEYKATVWAIAFSLLYLFTELHMPESQLAKFHPFMYITASLALYLQF